MTTSYTATYSPDDNKLRLYASSRLDPETYARVKALGFCWAPKQELFVAPMWTPEREDLLLELAGEIDDEDKSLVERAEERAERFDDLSEKRAGEAESARAAVSRVADGIPFGQPILVGHHSEKRARKDAERIRNGMDRAVKLWKAVGYWTDRAAGALRHAKHKERPDVRARRIKGLVSDERKRTATKEGLEKTLALWTKLHEPTSILKKNGGEATFVERAKAVTNYEPYGGRTVLLADGRKYTAWSALNDGLITPEEVQSQRLITLPIDLEQASRWLEHTANRLAYERAMLQESGGLVADKVDFQIGGRAFVGREWLVILRLNKTGGVVTSLTTNRRYGKVVQVEEVKGYTAPEAEDVEKVLAATKLPPMANYPEGAEPMTKAEWAKKHKDYKGSRVTAATETAGAHRRRTCVVRGDLVPIFISDEKVSNPPPVSSVKPTTVADIERIVEPRPEPTTPSDRQRTKAIAAAAVAELQSVGKVEVVVADQLFPTPTQLAETMAERLELREGSRILEPSAGTGRLLDAVKAQADSLGVRVELQAVEINRSLSEALGGKAKVAHGDFLEMCAADLGGRFDGIIMNPPFGKGVDVAHVHHALAMLKPGGRLVALCAGGPKQEDALRPLTQVDGGSWVPIGSGAFAEQGTNVRVVFLVINKASENADRMAS